MKKIITLFIIGLFFLSGFGAVVFQENVIYENNNCLEILGGD